MPSHLRSIIGVGHGGRTHMAANPDGQCRFKRNESSEWWVFGFYDLEFTQILQFV